MKQMLFNRFNFKIISRSFKVSCKMKQFKRHSSRNILQLKERGMIQDIFPNNSAQDIIDVCNGSTQCVYAGFDPTAKSLHVGNLLVMINLMHWQRGGHQVIALVGGATGRIGDPSGKSKERQEQLRETVLENTNTISSAIQKIFDNHANYFWKEQKELPAIKILDNSTWFSGINVVDFICGIGRNFRMGSLMSKTSVSSRLRSDTGMSFTEFAYQIFQAYDWLHLLKTYNCRFQVGGSDQMGNIVSGHELISRTSKTPVYGVTLPLITTDAGDKFGKSAHNAVWLDPDLTPPFEFYQFLIRTPDSQLSHLLKLFTFHTPPSIDDIVQKHMKNPEKREGQKILAEEVTLLVHGKEGLEIAKKSTDALYNSNIESLSQLDHENISKIFKGACQVQLLLESGITVMDLAMTAKCFLDQRDADRIIRAGGFYINQVRSRNPDEALIPGVHILSNYTSLIRVGKKNYWIVKWLR